MIDRETLIELIDYNPKNGEFRYKKRDRKWFKTDGSWKRWNNKYSGEIVGTVQVKGNGYRRIKLGILGKQYLAHRVAWVIMTGDNPPKEIDHIDRDATNNAWSNLSDGSNRNQKNKSIQRNNTSGVTGVSWSKLSKKWAARAWGMEGGNKVYKHLGLFNEKSDAALAVKLFREKNDYTSGHGCAPPYTVFDKK